jgi:hypothetical protein
MRLHQHISGWVIGAVMAAVCPATTLVKLSVDEMVAQSTDIVRGRVSNCEAVQRGSSIMTQCVVSVSERLKGVAASTMAIAIPGGAMRNASGRRVRQVIVGAPALNEKQEYLLFLWTGRTGVTQLIGLSQGALEIKLSGNQAVAQRAPMADAAFRNAQGEEVDDDGVSVTLDSIRQRVRRLAEASR